MRFLTCYRFKDKDGNIIKKCEVLTTRTNNIYSGQYQLAIKIGSEHNLPQELVERNEGDERQLGIFYIEPKANNSPMQLRDGDVDDSISRYEWLNRWE